MLLSYVYYSDDESYEWTMVDGLAMYLGFTAVYIVLLICWSK